MTTKREREVALIGDMHAHCMSIEPDNVGLASDGGCLLCKSRLALESLIAENERLNLELDALYEAQQGASV